MFGREEDLHGVGTTQPHRLAKGAQSGEQNHQQGSESFVSSVVNQNTIIGYFFFFSPENREKIYEEFVPEAKKINAKFCVRVMEILLTWCWEWCCSFEWKAVGSSCTRMLLVVLPWWWSGLWGILACWTARQLICLTLFNPAFFVFLKVKIAHQRRRFLDVEDIKKNITPKLNLVPLDAFYEFWATFRKM